VKRLIAAAVGAIAHWNGRYFQLMTSAVTVWTVPDAP
jgi:hypothetical protein